MTHAPTLEDMIPSWELALSAKNKAAGTIRGYLDSVRQLASYLSDHDLAIEIEKVQAEHIRRFLTVKRAGCWTDDDQTTACECGREPTSPGNAAAYFRNLRVFFNWLVREEELTVTPMANVEPPNVPSRLTEPLSDEQIEALLKTCNGKSLEDRRDNAIIRILVDNGMRVSGLAGLRYSPGDDERNDVFLARHQLRIILKGGDVHVVPIGKKTAAAIDRYVRTRARHPHADSPWLWLPLKGITAKGGHRRLTATGIQQMIERRGKEAGIPGRLGPHRFRHTMAGDYVDSGGDPLNLMRITGWKSMEMVRRYTEWAAEQRARDEHSRLSRGDRF